MVYLWITRMTTKEGNLEFRFILRFHSTGITIRHRGRRIYFRDRRGRFTMRCPPLCVACYFWISACFGRVKRNTWHASNARNRWFSLACMTLRARHYDTSTDNESCVTLWRRRRRAFLMRRTYVERLAMNIDGFLTYDIFQNQRIARITSNAEIEI